MAAATRLVHSRRSHPRCESTAPQEGARGSPGQAGPVARQPPHCAALSWATGVQRRPDHGAHDLSDGSRLPSQTRRRQSRGRRLDPARQVPGVGVGGRHPFRRRPGGHGQRPPGDPRRRGLRGPRRPRRHRGHRRGRRLLPLRPRNRIGCRDHRRRRRTIRVTTRESRPIRTATVGFRARSTIARAHGGTPTVPTSHSRRNG